MASQRRSSPSRCSTPASADSRSCTSCWCRCPTEDYLYLGDTARFPYGERSAEELRAFAIEIAEHLLDGGREAAGGRVQRGDRRGARGARAPRRRERPGRRRDRRARARDAAGGRGHAARGRVGLLATPATVASGAYEQRDRGRRPARAPGVGRVSGPGADHPVGGFPFDERGRRDGARVLRAAARRRGRHRDPRLHPLPARRADAAADARPRRDARLGGHGVARSVERALAARELLNPQPDEGSYRFQCTGDVDSFRELGTRFLQMPLGDVVHVELEARAIA